MTSTFGRFLLAGAVMLAPVSASAAEAAADAPSTIDGLLQTAAPSGPIVSRPPVFTDDDQLLFAVISGDLQLSDGFEAYSSRAGVFLPIGALARLIDVNLDVDPSRQRANGWVITPTRTLQVDLVARRIIVAGVETRLSEADGIVKDGDIYLRTSVIEKLLPLKITADVPGLNLILAPTEKLPFLERYERERRAKGLGAETEEGGTLLVPNPYRLFSPPFLDANINLGAGNHDPRNTGSYDVRVAGDVLGTGMQLFAGSDQDLNLASARILFTRKDPEGKTAGPFGATRSAAGDTFTPNLAIGARSTAGRGLAITSVPLEQASVFDRIDIRGELPLGYQVELYVNEVLRGSQTQPFQGRYEFLQVNLAYGLNVIRVVFYGPRGERREEVRRINVGGGQLKRGQTAYSFGAVQEGRSVFGIGDENFTGLPGTGEWRVTGQIAHGFSETLTGVASYARYTPFTGTRQMGSLGVVASLGTGALAVDVAGDDEGGSALAAGYAGRIGNTSIVGRHSEYRGGFVDEAQSSALGGVPLNRNTSLSIDTLIGLFGANVPASFRVARDEFESGAWTTNVDARLSRPFGRYLASTALTYRIAGGTSGAGPDALTGSVDVSGLVGTKWQVRAGASYLITPRFEVSDAAISADRNFGDRNALHLGVQHNFIADDTRFDVGETWRLKQADVSLVAGYALKQKDFRVGLQLALGFGYDPWRNRYAVLGPGVASGGAMAIDAFIDENGDGMRQPGEKPLPGLVVQGGRYAETTDKNGHAIITGMGDAAYGQATVDLSSLEDPYLLPPATNVKVVPRPGRMIRVPYAVSESGEVELRVLFQAAGNIGRGISALHIELVDAQGKVAASGSSEFDGTLIFEGVRPGTYQVRIEPAQAERLKMALVSPVSVTIKPGGGFSGKVNVSVASRSADPRPGATK
jgi:hypothetical protein